MIRTAPMISPIMHRIDAFVHFFFVPYRIVWDQWEDFITGQEEITVPYKSVQLERFEEGSLWDYFGMPTHVQEETGSKTVNTLNFRAYCKIWNEFYRDQDLQDEIDISDDNNIPNSPLKRAWEKDYFTSARPWAQKGDEATLPIQHNVEYYDGPAMKYISSGEIASSQAVNTNVLGQLSTQTSGGSAMRLENIEDIEASISINELREATAIQRWLEKNARAGNRYIETILAHFGIMSDDARLQRPEYLGGGRSPVQISDVVNTMGYDSNEANALPQGNLSGYSLSYGKTNKATCYAKEHGVIIGLLSVLPRTSYFKGFPREYQRRVKFDYYWPEFANLGEQEILNQEIFLTNELGTNEGTFGYQSRYAEYRYQPSTVHGQFKSTMKHWHLARDFASLPSLNANFIQSTPSDRVFAVDEPHYLWVSAYNKVLAKRPMPKYNTPRL
jgi:hypothetical protein